MTTAQIKEILKGRFENEEDRKYWERKLHEMEIKEQATINNAKKDWR